ncbi:MAG: LacI family DNA-binding transcriptional regulator [Eubacteriales bacterium]
MSKYSNLISLTIKDIAKMCNVSPSTVSRALNNSSDISEETRQYILSVVKDTGFVPNSSARNLKRLDVGCIALIVKGIENIFFTDIIKTVESECFEKGYITLMRHVDMEQDELDVAISLIKEQNLRGIIFMGGNCEHEKTKLYNIKIPCVFCTYHVKNSKTFHNFHSVCVDDQCESMRIVDYLLELGHRKIAIMVDHDGLESISQARLDGYKKAYRNHGLEVDKNLIYNVESCSEQYTVENGYKMACKIFESKKTVTAIYGISDFLAIGACRAAVDYGYKIPDDLSVVGFDGLRLTQYFIPRLTTIEQPMYEMALKTIHILLDEIQGITAPRQVILNGRLVVGESSAPPRLNV